MTTNKEWLFSLPLEEQIAWMESEHSEPNPDCSAMLYKMFTENMKHEPCSHYEPKDDVSGYGADFNVVEPNFDNIKAVEMDASRFEAVEMDASRLVVREPDSREKLEADVRRKQREWSQSPYALDTNVHEVIGWLDRQAAITHEEDEAYCKECFTETYKRERELGEAIDGLTEQVDRLTAERDNWKANCEDWKKHARAAENACYETMLEREDYRKKFGKCIDYADAIHALMDDEGIA